MTLTTSYEDYGVARRMHAMLADDSGTIAWARENLREIMMKLAYSGSGGIIALDSDCDPFPFYIASSSCVVAFRPIEPVSRAGAPEDPLGFRNVLQLSVVEQMQELQAALSLNKSQLARVLCVSRPALYEWFRGKDPSPANAERLHTLLRCLVRARVSGSSPLNARFVREPTGLDEPALLVLLTEERIDEDRVVSAIEGARALGDAAARGRAAREERLHDLGFEDPGQEQRREQLARNMALRDWPNQ